MTINKINNKIPVFSYSELSRLKDGTSVNITGEAYQEPIWPAGDPPVYSLVKIEAGNLVVGLAYFPEMKAGSELRETVAAFSLNPDQYLYER